MTEATSNVMVLVHRKERGATVARRYLALQCILDAVQVLEALGEQVLRSVHDHIVWARQPAVTGERLPQRLQPSKEIFLPKKTTNTQVKWLTISVFTHLADGTSLTGQCEQPIIWSQHRPAELAGLYLVCMFHFEPFLQVNGSSLRKGHAELVCIFQQLQHL